MLCEISTIGTVARRNIDHLLGEKHFEVMRHDVTFACTSASASANCSPSRAGRHDSAEVLAEINELRAAGDKPPRPECDDSKASNCVTHYVIERMRRFLARRHKVQGAAIADSHSMLGTFGADRSPDPQGIVF